MALKHQTHRGIGYLPSYQASAIPFVTSSLNVPVSTAEPVEISFDTISRFIVVTNTNSADDPNYPMRFGFSRNGIKGVENSNYIVLDNGDTYSGELRVSKVFLLSDSSIYASSGSILAGLTDIEARYLQTNWSGSIGVG